MTGEVQEHESYGDHLPDRHRSYLYRPHHRRAQRLVETTVTDMGSYVFDVLVLDHIRISRLERNISDKARSR